MCGVQVFIIAPEKDLNTAVPVRRLEGSFCDCRQALKTALI